jgi:hypothetical protein
MIRKDVVKYWVSGQELMKVLGFKVGFNTPNGVVVEEGDLLMDVKVRINPNAPLGHQVQGIDIFVEHPTEIKRGL